MDGHSHRSRVSLIVVAAAVCVVALAAGFVTLLVVRGRDAHQVTVEQAVERYEATTTAPGPTSSTSRPTGVSQPATGVYRLTGSGEERLSFQSGGQSLGPILPATVTALGDGCWEVRIDFNTNHWQIWRYCSDEGGVVDRGGSAFQRFDLVVAAPESTSTSVCEPPVPSVRGSIAPGTTWPERCSIEAEGDTSELVGTVTYVGPETMVIGGVPVEVAHTRYDRTYAGAQHGTETADTWYLVATGLPVQSTWHLAITSGSPIGDVTYTSAGTWTLESLVPTR